MSESTHEHNRQRHGDHETSAEGAVDVSQRAPTQRMRLLAQFADAWAAGLTDEEAADKAGLLDSCFWKRCNELRADGMIAYVEGRTRKGRAGVNRKVSAITDEGYRHLLAAGGSIPEQRSA